MARAAPRFHAARFDSMEAAVLAHRQGRARAVSRLRALNHPAERQVASAVCELIALEAERASPTTAKDMAVLKRRCGRGRASR